MRVSPATTRACGTMMRSIRSSPRGWRADRRSTAMERLQAAGVRAGAVFNARDMHLDPHAKARGLLETVAFPPGARASASASIIGRPWKLSRTPLAVRGPAPTLGQHNREVLQGHSGLRRRALRGAGAVRHHRHASDRAAPGPAHEHGGTRPPGAPGVLGPGLQGAAGHSGLIPIGGRVGSANASAGWSRALGCPAAPACGRAPNRD